MSRTGSLYIERESLFHKLDGSVKLLLLIAWTAFIFMFMDARVFAVMLLLGFAMLSASRLPYRSILPLLMFVIVFTLMNSLILMLITPEFGSQLIGRYSPILTVSRYRLTYETFFYAVTLSLKYLAILPVTLLFVFTTHPGSFAGSLNRLGISFKVAYAVSIALRYIPDVSDEVNHIINAQEARGVAFRRGDASLWVRMRNYGTVLLPLLISSLHRVEVVSNAMDLRGFGRYRTRTWYSRVPLGAVDFIFLALSAALIALGAYLKNRYFMGFWCP